MTMFVFDAEVPAGPDNPSEDQPDMLVNNISTLGLIGVDHVTFNSNGPVGAPLGGGGQHLQVTFNGNNVPSVSPLPTVPPALPVLFTNIFDGLGNALPNGLPQIFYYSGSAAYSSNQYRYIAGTPSSASTFIFGGFILKCGTVTATDNTAISFGLSGLSAFPNQCFGVQVTVYGNTNPATIVTVKPSPTPISFIPRVQYATGGSAPPISIFYLAFGN